MFETVEQKLIDELQKAIRRRKNLIGNIGSKLKSSIGFGLGYYITDLLKALPESNIKDKWIDGVDWKELRLYSPNKFKGYGFIWWGFTEDGTAETFPDKFYSELELVASTETKILYFFQFQIDRKNYELTNR
jgi:hypothetical protein